MAVVGSANTETAAHDTSEQERERAIEGQSPELAALAERLTQEECGIGLAEAQAKGICVQCKLPALPRFYSGAGDSEYRISGLCEKCFDDMFAEM